MIPQLFPYSGSSRRYAHIIAELINREGWFSYAEPFVGSGAVYFKTMPGVAYLGDAEYHIANLYTQVRDNVDGVIEILSTFPAEKEFFLQLQLDVRDMTGIEAAAAWYYLMLLTYNGVVRKRKDKERGGWRPWFTFGTGYKTWDRRFGEHCRRLKIASRIMSQFCDTVIVHGDYKDVPQADIGFFDPPWLGGKEKQYGVLNDFDYEELRDYLDGYGKWLLTINDRQETRDLFLPISLWHAELEMFYGIAPVPQGKGYHGELLITNFKPAMYGG